jgi:hypothetical protein
MHNRFVFVCEQISAVCVCEPPNSGTVRDIS